MPPHTPYEVLARKYRPKSFEEVVGQAGVVSTLRNAIGLGRLHHAYLFSGTRGVGKTTLARLFARALNCAKGPTVEPCAACDPCREIAAGSSMDVIEIDGASNRKVEDVDPLREAARHAPARDRHKIFIIDEVHMLSETAFNALLKVLEEPPPRVIFLFATTEPQELPDTILSRCLHLACRRVSRREIAEALERTALAERVEGPREAYDVIAGLASGSLRDGLSLLDQAIAFAGSRLTEQAVRDALGLIDRRLVREFVEAVGRQDAGAVLEVVSRLSEAGADLVTFCREALARVRDMMVCKEAGAAAAGAMGVPADEAAECEELSALYSSDGLLRLLNAMLELADRIRREENPRFLLEASALRMIRLVDLTPVEELLRRLGVGSPPQPAGPSGGAARRSQAAPGPAGTQASLGFPDSGPAGAPGRAAPASPAEATPTPPAGGEDFPGRLIEVVWQKKVSLAAFLQQARSIRCDGDAVIVAVTGKQAFLRSAIEAPDSLDVLREAAAALLGRPVRVRVEAEAPPSDDLSAAAAGAAAEQPARRREALLGEALKDPLVRAAMDLFKGQVVDIKESR